MNFYYVSLGMILLVGIPTVWEDLKYKKIRNKWIVFGFLSGVLLFLVSYPFNLVSLGYLLKVVINTLISLVAGFIVWKLGLWPAGDAKFFTLISFLLPLHYYKETYLNHFPSFVLLLNIFIPFLFFLIFRSLFAFLSAPKAGLETALLNLNLKNAKKLFFNITIGLLFYFLMSKFVFRSGPNLFSFFVFFLAFLIINFLLDIYTNERIRQTIPFAPWIFFGAVLTVLIKSNVISFIYTLF